MLWLAHELRPPSDYQPTYAAPSLHKKDSSVSCAESALKFSGLLPPTYREYHRWRIHPVSTKTPDVSTFLSH